MYAYVNVCICVQSYRVCVCTAPEKDRDSSELEVKVWEPNQMSDYKVEQFLVVARYNKFSIIIICYMVLNLITARSIGTFARALLDGAKKPQISLRLGAAAASRDITLVRRLLCVFTVLHIV